MVGVRRTEVERLDKRGYALNGIRAAERALYERSHVRAAHVESERDILGRDKEILRRRRVGSYGMRARRRGERNAVVDDSGYIVRARTVQTAPNKFGV